LRIHFCGVRGSTPAPGIDFVRYGGHTSCLALAQDGAAQPTLILDAGVGLQRASTLFGEAPFAGTILLSHLHWDHTLGMPFFAAGDRPDARATVLLPHQDGGQTPTSVLARVMSPPFFPIGPTDLQGEWTFSAIMPGELRVEGFEVLAQEIPHKGGRTFGYRISDGHSTLAYMPDHCPTALGPGEDGFGEYHPAAIELAHGADVLVHDAQLFPEELAADARFGHAVADYAVELGRRAGTRSVVLFHHRQDRTDEALDGLAQRFQGAYPHVIVAKEGDVLNP
jgi:phosphoribosyl 1,2-cyclic phosphodiesterase